MFLNFIFILSFLGPTSQVDTLKYFNLNSIEIITEYSGNIENKEGLITYNAYGKYHTFGIIGNFQIKQKSQLKMGLSYNYIQSNPFCDWYLYDDVVSITDGPRGYYAHASKINFNLGYSRIFQISKKIQINPFIYVCPSLMLSNKITFNQLFTDQDMFSNYFPRLYEYSYQNSPLFGPKINIQNSIGFQLLYLLNGNYLGFSVSYLFEQLNNSSAFYVSSIDRNGNFNYSNQKLNFYKYHFFKVGLNYQIFKK